VAFDVNPFTQTVAALFFSFIRNTMFVRRAGIGNCEKQIFRIFALFYTISVVRNFQTKVILFKKYRHIIRQTFLKNYFKKDSNLHFAQIFLVA